MTRLLGPVLALSLATTLFAQQQQQPQSSYPSGTPSSTNWDCADPLQVGATQSQAPCPAQSPEDLNSSQSLPTTTPAGQLGVQPRNNNYSDTAPQTSQQTANRNPQQPVVLPPEPLTEFQKFVASTTGQILPIYGANLFRRVPSTFAPVDMAPVPADYVIGPDDVLRIRVWGQVTFQNNLRVDRSGDIYIPQIGSIHVQGLRESELDPHLRAAIGRVYRSFDLTVDVGQIKTIQVYLAGEARSAGLCTVSSLSTLVDTLFACGGVSVRGSLRHIEVRRDGAVVTDFDLYNLLIRGDKSKDAKLQPGDVIFIPPAGPQVAVTGSVRNAGIYELRTNEPLSDLLADAGGVSSVASARISIERIDDHRNRQAMEVASDKAGLATPMADGDLVRVYSIVPKYEKTVTLRGNTNNPGRFPWHAGMHISELIPDKDSLLTNNYWWTRAQLGLPAPDFEPIPGFNDLRQPATDHPVAIKPTPRTSQNQNEPQQSQDQDQRQDQDQPTQS